MIETDIIAYIQIIKGKINADMDKLSKLLWDNYHNRLSDNVSSIRYEDSFCPADPLIDEIIDEIQTNFEKVTGEKIYNTSYWGHIHEKNMSTNTHNHKGSYVSAVVYAQTPKDCGQIVFLPKLNPYENSTYKSKYVAKKGTYFMFPSFLDHFVTRNNSDDIRMSLSLNFNKS